MKDHVLLGKYLQGDIPEFDNIWTNVMPMLSSGEKRLVQIALTLYNGHTEARLADIFMMDAKNRERVINAIQLRLSELPA